MKTLLMMRGFKMIPKPDLCIGCPFYTKGKYFTPDTIVSNSEVMFIAQNPGPNEEAGRKVIKRNYIGHGVSYDEFTQVTPQPLIGATGNLFNDRFLPLTGFKRSEVSIGNAIRCRPGSSLGLKADELPHLTNKMHLETSKADAVVALRHCKAAYFKPPPSVKLIVTMGAYPLMQMTGQTSVLEWRGYAFDIPSLSHLTQFNTMDTHSYHPLTSDIKVFATMHIAALYKGDNKRYYHATLQDFGKIKRLLNKKWPLVLPHWSDTAPDKWPVYSSFDTEYIQETGQLLRWSLCDTDNNLYCVESINTERIPITKGSTVLMQNALADIRHLSSIVDINSVTIEDMMLAHSVLYTGEPHGLNYIASIFGALNRYKHLAHDQEQLYSAMDAFEPMYIWRTGLIPQFKQDAQSYRVYKQYTLPLINIINRAQQTGIRINTDRLKEAHLILQNRVNTIRAEAKVITGDERYEIGSSKRTRELIYGIAGIPNEDM